MSESVASSEARLPAATRRLPYANTEDPKVKPVWDKLGFVQDNFFRMLAHAPTLIGPLGALVHAIFDELELKVRPRELAIMHVNHVRNVRSTWAWHFNMAQEEAGVTRDQLIALRRGEIDCGLFSDDDRILLRFVDEQLLNGVVSDNAYADAKTIFSDRELIELMILTGAYALFGNVMETTEIHVDYDSDDDLQRVPRA